jgi:hypothetical protein
MKKRIITVKGSDISINSRNQEDYISLTDMVRNFEDGSGLIEKWLRNKNTIEFIGIWEQLNNPVFNSPEFEGIKNEAGLNRFTLSVKKWIEKLPLSVYWPKPAGMAEALMRTKASPIKFKVI